MRVTRLITTALLAVAAQTHAAEKQALQPVSIVLQWDHQSQFAGYYMALDKGFYEKEGLDVTIIRGGPDVRPCEMLAAGKAQFCTTMLSTALEKREGGMPLVLVSQIINRSNFEVVAWKKPDKAASALILQPDDLNGRSMTVWKDDFRLPFMTFLDVNNIKMRVLPQYYSLSLFINHGVDACSAMHYNEYHWLLQHGVDPEDLTVFPLWQYGVDLPEDGIYATADMVSDNPQICRAFARASIEGWRYAKNHQDEALDAVMERVNEVQLPSNRTHMRWMLDAILASVFPEGAARWTVGQLSEKSYMAACKLLEKGGSISSVPAYSDFVMDQEAQDVEP
ncbi:MAG: ABC transporter substrate-binding protein [Opitutales bacterium]|jgi:NitT/TauT family transport system substrate-binding protein